MTNVGTSRRSAFAALILALVATSTVLVGQAAAEAGGDPLPGFSKEFAPDGIPMGGVSTLTFTISNTALVAATDLDFTDGLPAGVVVATPSGASTDCTGGTLTAVAGSGTITYTGGSVAASSTCTVTVDVTSDTADTYTNTSGELTSSLGNSGTATDDLAVLLAPMFDKVFAPDVIAIGGVSTLTFTITNPNTSLSNIASDLAFSDTLPAGVVIATPSGAATDCLEGEITAVAGGDTISFSGGAITVDTASCTVSVDVTSSTSGTHTNTSGELTSNLGSGGTATDDLIVADVPGFSKEFVPDVIGVGGVSTLTFTITNTSTLPATSLDFSDTLPAGVVIATPSGAVTDCSGGTLTATAGTGTISYTGGSVAADSTCTISVDVTSSTVDTHSNTSGALTSSLGDSGTAADDLTVLEPPEFGKVFAPDVIAIDGVSTLTFTITNPNHPSASISGIDFTDALPADVVIATPSGATTDCADGTLTAVAGGDTISFTGGVVDTASCTVSVDVTSSTSGTHTNTSGELTSNLGSGGTATDDLIVAAVPGFSKEFVPDAIGVGFVSTLTFTITNTSTLPATSLDFSDTLPAGVVVATPSGAVTDCSGGTLTATAGTGTISYTGGSVAADTTCTISVDVTSASLGSYSNTSGALTSSLGDSGTATDDLLLADVPGFEKEFGPDTIGVGEVSTLTFTITNPNDPSVSITGIDFTDVLPADVVIATPSGASTTCSGGILTAPDGGDTISFSGGAITVGTPSCTVSVDVTSVVVDTYTNASGELTSNFGNSDPATDDLTVLDRPEFKKSFDPVAIVPGGVSTLTFTITNPNDPLVDPITDLDFTDTLPPGLVIATPSGAATDCSGGTLTAADGAGTISYTGGTLDAGTVLCTISVDVTAAAAGFYPNETGDLTSNLGNSGTAEAGLPVGLSFGKTFAPNTIGPGSTSQLTFLISNQTPVPIEDVSFTDDLPTGLVVATPANASTSCSASGGSGPTLEVTAGGTTITLADSSVGGFSECTVIVDVTASAPGVYANVSGPLMIGEGEVDTAADDLTVDAELPGFSKTFDPSTVSLGANSTLRFTIDNSAPGSVLHLFPSFSDTLPADMVVATPASASTDCPFGIVTAVPGTNVVSFFGGNVGAGDVCMVEVDVTTTTNGTFDNISDELGTQSGSAGFATATLEVPLAPINKVFLDDPVAPGTIVDLQFTLQNPSRTEDADDIEFTDDLTFLTGLTAFLVDPDPPCGPDSEVTGTTTISFAGGELPPGGSCTFTVSLIVPDDATPGDYTNTTSTLTATVGGEPFVTEGGASDDLTVELFPLFTKEFGDPVGAGGPVTLEFTLTNTTSSALMDLEFFDDLSATLPGLAANELVDGHDPDPIVDPCGSGSELTVDDPFPTILPPDPTFLIFTGGSLAAAGSPGDSCTFSVTLDVPVGAEGDYPNTTSELTGATSGEDPVTGPPATDDLTVVGGVTLSKEFLSVPPGSGEPVFIPGDDATLEFTITNSSDTATATGIDFTDDLTFVTDLIATGPVSPVPPCGAGSSLTVSAGGTLLTFEDGTLAPGASCTFSVPLSIPEDAPLGEHTNETSTVDAVVGGVPTVGAEATDILRIVPISITKSFTDDPVMPGYPVTLEFTITLDSLSPTAATSIFFRDDLSSTLDPPGAGVLTAVGLPIPVACDPDGAGGDPGTGMLAGSAGNTLLTFSGGELDPGESCTFSVSLAVPGSAEVGEYLNVTELDPEEFGGISATIDGKTLVGAPASDVLIVALPLPPELTKEFVDDPVLAGDDVTLKFTLLNPNDPDTFDGITLDDISFEDDLDAALSGLEAIGATSNTCGGGAVGMPDPFPTGVFVYEGGTLGPEETCEIVLTLSVPDGAPPGLYPNTTGPPTGHVLDNGSPGPGSEPATVIAVLEGEPATDTLEVVAEADLSVTKVDSADPVEPTDTLTYTVTVTNNGPDTATDVIATDTLPAGVTFVSTSGCDNDPVGVPVCTLGTTLAQGASRSYDVTVTVDPDTVGTITNSVTVSGGSFDPDTGDNTATEDTGVPVADVSVTKTDGVARAVPGGDTLTYVIVVANDGPSLDPAVVVADAFPARLTCTYTSAAAGGATGNTASGAGDIGDVLSMPAGSSVTYTADCEIAASARGTVSNTATATASVTDPDPSNNSATDTTVLRPQADLVVVKIDSVDPVDAGARLVYSVSVSNLGPSDARNVVVTDTLPADVSLVGAPGCVEGPPGVLTCSYGTVAVGATKIRTIKVDVDADAADGSRLVNTAVVDSSTRRIEKGDDFDRERTTVVNEPEGPERELHFLFRNTNTTGPADFQDSFGDPGDDLYVADRDGDGVSEVLTRAPGTNVFTVWEPAGVGPSAVRVGTFSYGVPGDEAFFGDWDGNGTETPAVRRGKVVLGRNGMGSGPAQFMVSFGLPTDQLFVGDWDNDGDDTLAVVRGNVILGRNSLTSGPATFVFGYGRVGDEFHAARWRGAGDTFAVRRGDNLIRVRNSLTTGVEDFSFNYGRATDSYFRGDWNGDGVDTMMVVRPQQVT